MIISDNIFRLIVYFIGFYLIVVKNSVYINIVGLIILIAHFYKDLSGLSKWPYYIEYIGLILGYILIYEGYLINNFIIIICGLLKFSAHIRQLLYNDNCYYY